MALVYVGGTSGVGTTATYAVSLSGTLTGGVASSPSAGDIVVVFSGFGNNASATVSVTGNNYGAYPLVTGTTQYHQNDTWDTEFAGLYAIQGATPDTSLTIGRVASGAYGGATVVQVWRGVDTTTPFDVTATVAGAGNSSRVNPPLITPTTAGAVILAGGTGTQTTSGSAFVVSSNMAGPSVTTKGDGTTSDTGTCIASHEWTTGSFTPNVVTGGTTSTSCSWRAMTLALRPAPVNDYNITASGGTYSQVGGSATLSKSNLLTASGGSYSLAGQQVTITTGAALNNFVLTASGGSYTFTGQSANLNRNRKLTSSGGAYALTGQSATLLKSKRIVSTGGAYALSGASATLLKTKLITALGGAYSFTGQQATVTYTAGAVNYTLTALGGAYSIAGQQATLLRSRLLSASGGAYALAGQQATVTYTPAAGAYVITAQGGTYTLSGASANITSSATPATPTFSQEVELKRKWYVRRDKKIHVFATAQDADAYLEAEEKAKQLTQNKTSRLARKRVRQKVYQPLPLETIDTGEVQKLVGYYALKVDFPRLIVEQDFDKVMEIVALARQMQEDEDVELLLLAA